ncbi:hypothetical protein ACWN8V_06980 [Vagococcus elongatus]|uniref:Uncharacterized protein n=1 Tax=Vagococcus elongatus TaxID=180344 RepID=A0A430AW52_9ENTE|nr:hypothetical protein [Vagococcus elongatus]RSU12278.1 hypothetical protein CBF29_06670 [Vagococcus elongatus]
MRKEYISVLKPGNVVVDVSGMYMITDCEDDDDKVTVLNLSDGTLESKYTESVLSDINFVLSIDFLESINEVEDWMKKQKGIWKW